MYILLVTKLVTKLESNNNFHISLNTVSNEISFRFFLLKRRQKTNGDIPVYLRITKDRKYSMLSTGIAIQEKFWNESKQEVRKSHPRQTVFNTRLDDILIKAKETAWDLEQNNSTIHTVKKALSKNPGDIDFFVFANEHITQLHERESYWEWKKVKTAVNKLKSYVGNSSLAFNEIDSTMLEGFKGYLFNKIGNDNNTVIKQLQRIRQITTKALKQGLIDKDPFLLVEPVKAKKSQKARLSIGQIKSIEALELPLDSWLDLTRDIFLFSFYNAGIRFGDIARMKWSHIVDGRLKYNMAKTGTGKNIKLLNPALEILDKYNKSATEPECFIFSVLDSAFDYSDGNFVRAQISSKNAIVNKNLKQIAKLTGIQENVSFHVARHSFADFARTSGMDLYNISKALGHSDITITQAYLKAFDETSLDSEMEKLMNNRG